MRDAFIIGTSSTPFGKWPDRDYKDLTGQAFREVLSDSGLNDAAEIASAWFGNCGMWVDGQGSVRGQVCLMPLIRAGVLPERIPIINVEGGCATASIALHGACKDVASGQMELSLAIATEKTFHPGHPERTNALYQGGIDQLNVDEWQAYYSAMGERAGKPFELAPNRTIFMDTYALQACYHMKKFGTTQRQIAYAAAKNHTIAQHNPLAQYRSPMTVEQVLADKPVTYPLTRSMCAPIGDGAAAALVCSEGFLRTAPSATQNRAVRIAAAVLTSGKYRDPDEPSLSHVAASKAYRIAGIQPSDIHVAEVHDATSFCEIYQAEMLGFCAPGEGGPLVESGATSLGGRIPINLSGGLVSKGHPVGATGLSMIHELALQLRCEAGPRQSANARWAMAENGGGVVGFDEAACAITILERT